ncbi:MAG: ImmA/IrrE family metallo-endopeptidase [Methyloceanibacter sp.]
MDRACEGIVSKFLSGKYGRIEFPLSTDDLGQIIEVEAEDLDLGADLSTYGPDVEGVTEFQPKRKPLVKISKVLAADERYQNRLRTTLAHEYGHVHFHAYLWETQPPGADLLKRNPDANRQICKRDEILNAAQSDWMEWQAGYVCGAILMPASRVRRLAGDYLESQGLYGAIGRADSHGQALIEAVIEAFQVSADAARIRLLKLEILGESSAGPSLFDLQSSRS